MRDKTLHLLLLVKSNHPVIKLILLAKRGTNKCAINKSKK